MAKTKPAAEGTEGGDAATATDNAPTTEGAAPPAATTERKTAARPANLPSRCRIVEYTTEEGDTVAAIVTAVRGHELHLGVFDPLFGYGLKCIHVENDARDKAGEPGKWNWPSRQ